MAEQVIERNQDSCNIAANNAFGKLIAGFPVRNRNVRFESCGQERIAPLAIGPYVFECPNASIDAKRFDEANRFWANFGLRIIWIFDVSSIAGSFKPDAETKQHGSWVNAPTALTHLSETVHENAHIYFLVKHGDDTKVLRVP